jgi:hypothetical protein
MLLLNALVTIALTLINVPFSALRASAIEDMGN